MWRLGEQAFVGRNTSPLKTAALEAMEVPLVFDFFYLISFLQFLLAVFHKTIAHQSMDC